MTDRQYALLGMLSMSKPHHPLPGTSGSTVVSLLGRNYIRVEREPGRFVLPWARYSDLSLVMTAAGAAALTAEQERRRDARFVCLRCNRRLSVALRHFGRLCEPCARGVVPCVS